MKKQIRLNAFDMNSASHQSPGLWRHPRDRSSNYTDLGYWTDLARTLERGKFDGIFLADVMGVYDVYGGTPDVALRSGVQVPVNDPSLIVPAMAMVTEHLGFGVTCTLSYEPPYPFARRMSTLDHLTNGRIGWNIVTGYLDSAAKGAGREKQISHDRRYEIAEEYMDVVYKLWEASWDDDAVKRDAVNGMFTDPAKVRRIQHRGEHYQLDAVHLSEPSPQRTPVLYQAGASPKGMGFAAKHAECIFVNGPSRTVLASAVSKSRSHIAQQGRDPSQVLIFAGLTVIVGQTDKEATERLHEYRQYVDRDGALALMSGWTGIDFSTYDKDDRVQHIRNDAVHSAVDRFTIADPNKVWTIGEVAEFVGIGGAGPVVVGSPTHVADELEAWMKDTGVDGFNLMYTVMPECFTDFVDLVVPELQRRGVYKTEYLRGTLREKLIGNGARTSLPHPSAILRIQAKASSRLEQHRLVAKT
jgi:FMN-dependent oxidoreductase (nitrilotriacetate monooxygenase family)